MEPDYSYKQALIVGLSALNVMGTGEILTGNAAQKTLAILLDTNELEGHYPPPFVTGYFEELGYYICFDNTKRCCFVEQALTEELALSWCRKEIEAVDLIFPANEKRFD